MKMSKKAIRHRQMRLERMFIRNMIMNAIIVLLIMFCVLVGVSGNNKNEGGFSGTGYESYDHNTVIPPANASTEIEYLSVETEHEVKEFTRGLSSDDKYLLAKLAMAEAEGESYNCKAMIVMTVLNRVEDEYFPDTIKEVIFQCSNGVYQFTPISDGRWERVEPNEECWNVVEYIDSLEYDLSNGSLYFEACKDENNWHSRNLEFICQIDHTRFYK